MLKKLQSDYLRSPNVNNRNGALIAFASIAVALDTAIVDFFPVFLNSVLKCLDDNDSKVRYYSSEALYNIAKAAQTRVLVYFDQFFYALCQLFSDVDTDVKKISLSTHFMSFLILRSISARQVAERDCNRSTYSRSGTHCSATETMSVNE